MVLYAIVPSFRALGLSLSRTTALALSARSAVSSLLRQPVGPSGHRRLFEQRLTASVCALPVLLARGVGLLFDSAVHQAFGRPLARDLQKHSLCLAPLLNLRIESCTLALDLVEALTAGQNGRLSLALVLIEQARCRRVIRPPGSWLVPLAVRLRLGLPFGRLERAKTVS